MKKYIFFYLLSLASFAQQATVIDAKSIILPRYASLSAITTALPTPQHGMMVYNIESASNWYYNGSIWVNMAISSSQPQGFGSWGCENAALTEYQPVGNIDGGLFDYFGSSVALSGDYALIGAFKDVEAFNLPIENTRGFVSMYKRNSNTKIWELKGKLMNQDISLEDKFGYSIAMTGEYAIVGAYGDDIGAGLTNSGSASMYKINTSTGAWVFQGKILNTNPASDDYFGYSVAISGDYAIVGAESDNEGVGLTNNGSASIFKRNIGSGQWEFQVKLVNPNSATNDNFGRSVAISGDYAIVGAAEDDEGAGLTENGSASIFKRNTITGTWVLQSKLVNSSATSNDGFGRSVAISGDYAIIGVPGDDEGAGLTDNGSAIIYKRNSGTDVWEFQFKLIKQGAINNEFFGSKLALSGDYAIITAYNDYSSGGSSFSIYKKYGEVWRLLEKGIDPASEITDTRVSCSFDGTTARFIISAPNWFKGTAVFGKVK